MGQWQSNQLKQPKFVTKSDGKMNNAFHREAGSKIQLYIRQAGCSQEMYRVTFTMAKRGSPWPSSDRLPPVHEKWNQHTRDRVYLLMLLSENSSTAAIQGQDVIQFVQIMENDNWQRWFMIHPWCSWQGVLGHPKAECLGGSLHALSVGALQNQLPLLSCFSLLDCDQGKIKGCRRSQEVIFLQINCLAR